MNLRNILIAATAMSAIAGGAFAQASATATAPSDAAIVAPLSIAAVASTRLSFGTIVKPSSGTSLIRVSAGGVRSLENGNATLLTGGTTPQAASFNVAGEGAKTFSITAANFNLISGANILSVTPVLDGTTGTISGLAGATGTAAVAVGGDLVLAAGTVNGAYAGVLSVTVAYN